MERWWTIYAVKLTRANLPANAINFTCGSHVKKPRTQFTYVACSLPVKTFYAASTSRRIHAIVRNNARKLPVTSPTWCKLTYLQFAGEITRGVIADCLQLQVLLCTIAGFLTCVGAGVFACVCSCFCLLLQLFLPACGRHFSLRF